MYEVFEARYGATIVVVPGRFLARLLCLVLDAATGRFHDYSNRG